MILIGERINGMFKDVRDAIMARDKELIEYLAKLQTKAGAHYLDISTGPAVTREKQPEVMEWLVATVQSASPLPCCLDSTSPEAIEAGLKTHRGKAMINSTSAEQAKMEIFMPMAIKYNACLIGLAMNEKGVPKSAAERTALAMELVINADAYGLPMQDLYIDPLVLPVNVAQDHVPEVLETIRCVKLLADPPPRTVIGLSNISQRCVERRLLNRTFLVMCMTSGLDSAIVDLEDKKLTDAVAATMTLLNKSIYCDSFLKAFKRL